MKKYPVALLGYTPTKPAHITPQPRLQNLETTYNKPIKETSLN